MSYYALVLDFRVFGPVAQARWILLTTTIGYVFASDGTEGAHRLLDIVAMCLQGCAQGAARQRQHPGGHRAARLDQLEGAHTSA
jgi:hypothetical protein